MWEALRGNFMPHGHCYLWSPSMVWLQVLSNLLIGLSYISISSTLYVIIRRIKDIPFSWMYLAFGIFIVTCGVTHFLDVVTVWVPVYWLDGGVRALTAIASVGTALLLFPLVPKAISLAAAAQVAHERGQKLESTYRELTVAHERTKELERLKTQFFANISHELRTPLALVLGPTERLLASDGLASEQRRDLEVIGRNARTLLKHVNDLLDVAKLEAGKMVPSFTRADLAVLVRLVASHFDALARDRHMTFEVQVPESVPAEIDADKVERVLLNVLSNAFKFTPERGTVFCSLVVLDGGARARLDVADSGPGVHPDFRAHVFERFAQADAGTTRRFGGTGLGLAIARDFVALHGGTIEVGDAPLGGALFRVALPLRAPEGADVLDAASRDETTNGRQTAQITDELRARVDALEPSGGARPAVLVVEDNLEMNAFVSSTLRAFDVDRAFDGDDGLQRALARRPDLVVSDVMMPGMGGDELVRAIRARPELDAVPILMLTAKADDELRVRLLREGAQDYVMKPFSGEELSARATNLVAMKRARDILQRELASNARDLELLASELGSRKRELETALETVRVARDHAERASQLKSDFLGLVSHELRTPLTSMQLLIDRLTEGGKQELSERQKRLMDRMAASTSRLTDLVDSLLQYAKIQSGRVSLDVEATDLAQVAAEVVEELRPQAERKGLRVDVTVSGESAVETDVRLLRLVVSNLLGNAVKFTERGSVRVAVAGIADARVIAVEDSGPGITAIDQARIFQPFQQLEPTRNKHAPGVGLGLSIVRDLAEALGANVSVRSEVGRGTTFEVSLPATFTPPTLSGDGAASESRLVRGALPSAVGGPVRGW